MLTIKNGKILLTKGDSAYIGIDLTDALGEDYEMKDGDKLTLTVRRSADALADVKLQATSDSTTIRLSPEQTGKLSAGNYSYDVQLDTAAGDRFTIVGASSTSTSLNNFIILPEVTTND